VPSIRRPWTSPTSAMGRLRQPHAAQSDRRGRRRIADPHGRLAIRRIPRQRLRARVPARRGRPQDSRDPVELRRELLTENFRLLRARWTGEAARRRGPGRREIRMGFTAAPRAGRRGSRDRVQRVPRPHRARYVAEVSVERRGTSAFTGSSPPLIVPSSPGSKDRSRAASRGVSYAQGRSRSSVAGSSRSFRDFPVLGISEMPQVEVHTIATTARPTGFESPRRPSPRPSPPRFAATGRRVYRLPNRPEDLFR
jgi:hypothetical protein